VKREILAQLTEGMFDYICHMSPDQAKKQAYAYGSFAHHELLRLDIQDDQATIIVEAALRLAFERLGLGEPD
jgi:hypothetical protein